MDRTRICVKTMNMHLMKILIIFEIGHLNVRENGVFCFKWGFVCLGKILMDNPDAIGYNALFEILRQFIYRI